MDMDLDTDADKIDDLEQMVPSGHQRHRRKHRWDSVMAKPSCSPTVPPSLWISFKSFQAARHTGLGQIGLSWEMIGGNINNGVFWGQDGGPSDGWMVARCRTVRTGRTARTFWTVPIGCTGPNNGRPCPWAALINVLPIGGVLPICDCDWDCVCPLPLPNMS